MIEYKCDVLKLLKERGYNTTRIRRECLLSEGTLTRLRRGEVVTPVVLDKICELLDCGPEDLIQRRKD